MAIYHTVSSIGVRIQMILMTTVILNRKKEIENRG